ncbi:MAG: nickel-dependent hydrogenase large subunit [Gallionella sp.]|nr:nickel-dependent hydrogenase large subunit [Gallionella sp.]
MSSERPEVLPLLRGRTTGQAVRIISLMFALCGQAQTRAAMLALSAARGEECTPMIDVEVQREALREHLWRCLLDLPPLLGEAALQQEFVLGVKAIAEGRRDELLALLTRPGIQALRMRLRQLDDAYTSASHFLPIFDARNSLAAWPRLSAEFCRRPEWNGAAAETGALARKHADSDPPSMSAHWQARFDELAEWASGRHATDCVGSVSAVPVAPGIGRALVEIARGLLMHEVVLDGDVVTDYLIVAPTEWNFHPQGVLHDRLLGADARDRGALRQQIARLVTTLDPCVPWELEWA